VGDEPPFRTPVFVMTHHHHPPIHFDNGTSFHVIDASPEEALEQARQAANGQDVRLGGGPSTIRQFLQADLVDFKHLVTVPLVLGSGVSLWNGLAGMHERIASSSSPLPAAKSTSSGTERPTDTQGWRTIVRVLSASGSRPGAEPTASATCLAG
jgi:dihydrofolate reductase